MSAAIEAAMMDALAEGLSVIPLRSNKRPAVPSWKEYIDDPADLLQVQSWAKSCQGFAILGGGPTRLQILDFEAQFMQSLFDETTRVAFNTAMREAGAEELFVRWRKGYYVVTPTGGCHVAVHISGDGIPPGNVKLAMDAEGQTLVETRGHGGYVVAAPSNGNTHPNGGKWVQVDGSPAEICWATEEEWAAVCSAISTFDASAAASETPPEALHSEVLPGGVSLSRIEHSSSWIDDLKMPTMGETLEHFGWTYHHSDAEHDYWSRPTKPPEEGHSASVNRNGRIAVFSSKAHPVPMSPNNYRTTYDVIDIGGCYQLGRLPTQAERVELMRSYRQIVPPDHIRTPVDIPVVESGWLSDDFWEATEWLRDIRAAAWGNGACPEALLGAVYSASLVRIPSSIRLAPIVHGVSAPLNGYVALCGMSGSGKTSTMGMAQELVGAYDDVDYRYGVNLRSGEGLVTAVLIPTKRGEEGPPRHRLGVQVEFDEGKSLAMQNDRSGSTMIPYLTTSWSGRKGAKVGGVKAAGEEQYPADMVRITLVLGVQYGVAGSLFTGDVESQGFPGRFIYFGMDNLGPALRAGEQRRIRPLTLPRYVPGDAARAIGEMNYSLAVQQEILDWDRGRQTTQGAAIDGHRMQLRARFGCWMALMDNSAHPSDLHWQLAGEVEKHSLVTRTRVLEGIRSVSTQHAVSAGRMDAVRENARHDAWIEERAVSLAKAVHTEPLTWRRVKDRFNSATRQHAAEVVTYAIERGWVQYAVGETPKRLIAGERQPPR